MFFILIFFDLIDFFKFLVKPLYTKIKPYLITRLGTKNYQLKGYIQKQNPKNILLLKHTNHFFQTRHILMKQIIRIA